jgi:hypothetical protein
MALTGANVSDLEYLAGQMSHAADRLETIRNEITAALARTTWGGDDADEFRAIWKFRLAGMLTASATATTGAAVVLRRNARQQWEASTGGGGLNPLPPGWHGGRGWHCDEVDRERVERDLHAHGIPLTMIGILAGGAGEIAHILEHAGVAGRLFARASPVLRGIDYAIEGGQFIHGVFTDPHGNETYESGVSLAAGLTTGLVVGAAIGGPVGAVVGGVAGFAVSTGIHIIEDIHPGLTREVFETAVTTFTDVAGAATGVVEDVGQAVGGFVSNGVNGFKSLFGW